MKKNNLKGGDKTAAANIEQLQTQAADALNELLGTMVKEKYRIITPIHFFGIAFAVNGEPAGFKFVPNNLNSDHLKWKASEPDELDGEDAGNDIVYIPSPPSFKDIARPANKAKTVSPGVRK